MAKGKKRKSKKKSKPSKPKSGGGLFSGITGLFSKNKGVDEMSHQPEMMRMNSPSYGMDMMMDRDMSSEEDEDMEMEKSAPLFPMQGGSGRQQNQMGDLMDMMEECKM